MDILSYQRDAWNQLVETGCVWTLPVTSEQIAAARTGDWHIVLTPTIPVPRDWFPAQMQGADILCLASGGGQQGPILAAAGATVTVFDNSPRQLARDQEVAEREGLSIRLVQGDMADLSVFADASFDLVVNPVSTVFVPDVKPVWREAARVLRPGGSLITGFAQPCNYIYDQRGEEYVLRFSLPYSDLHSLSEEERLSRYGDSALEFGHTLTDLIGGQTAAGLWVTALYEDIDPNSALSKFFPEFIATRSLKPKA